jgi:hypothetical protein
MDSNILAAALVRAANGLAADAKALPPGEYEVACTVALLGRIRKGAPHQAAVAQSARPWDLLALALSKLNGVTVASLVREVLEGGVESLAESVKKQADEAMATLVAATRREVAGPLTGDVTVAEVVDVRVTEVPSVLTQPGRIVCQNGLFGTATGD